MKRFYLICLIPALIALLAGCGGPGEPSEAPAPETTAATEARGQWVQGEKGLCYQDENGLILTGWQKIAGGTYCFLPDGTMLTGWINDNGNRYYLGGDGKMVTGWQEMDGKRFCFGEDGVLATGWRELEGKTYYFGVDGSLITGLMNIEGKGYYFDADGTRRSGWLTLDQNTYYFDEKGVMAVGPAEIDGEVHYFSPHGVYVPLVNYRNQVPEGYAPELVNVTERDRMAAVCAEALEQMLQDCQAAGHAPLIVSAYRTHEEQVFLYERKVDFYLDLDWEQEEAEREAAKSVAVPGTSEHQLGLAVDIVDKAYPYLDDAQAKTGAQQWLMAHCHEYGFILRYPTGTTDITGIIFEPWHYRYVGVEIALEITNLGITLEEYLGAA